MIWTLVFLLAMGGLVGQHFSLRRNLGYFYLAVAFWVCLTIKSRFHKKAPAARARLRCAQCRRSRLRRARTPWTVRNPPRPPGKARPYSPSFPCGSPLRHLTLAADGPRQRGAVDSCRPDGERRQPRGAGHRGEGATARVCAVAGRRICSRPECSGGAPVKDVKYLVCARVCLPQGVSLRCVQLVASTEASEHVASPAHAHEDISTHTRG